MMNIFGICETETHNKSSQFLITVLNLYLGINGNIKIHGIWYVKYLQRGLQHRDRQLDLAPDRQSSHTVKNNLGGKIWQGERGTGPLKKRQPKKDKEIKVSLGKNEEKKKKLLVGSKGKQEVWKNRGRGRRK